MLDGRNEYLPNEAMTANPTKLANGSWSDEVRGHGLTIMSLSAARREKEAKPPTDEELIRIAEEDAQMAFDGPLAIHPGQALTTNVL